MCKKGYVGSISVNDSDDHRSDSNCQHRNVQSETQNQIFLRLRQFPDTFWCMNLKRVLNNLCNTQNEYLYLNKCQSRLSFSSTAIKLGFLQVSMGNQVDE